MRRVVANPNYLKFTAAETICIPKSDRGQLRTNDMGEFFHREFIVAGVEKFACASPELERAMIDAGCRAGQPIGIARIQQKDRTVIWHIRRIGEVAEIPRQHRTFPHNGRVQRTPMPDSKYAAPPQPAFPECEPPAGRAEHDEATPVSKVPQREARAHAANPECPILSSPPSLIGRCLRAAIEAAADAEAHGKSIGFACKLGPSEIQAIAVTLYIQANRNLEKAAYAPPRKSNATVAGYVNGRAAEAKA